MEVIQKLNKLKVYGDSTEEYIAHLINNDFLNEKRFAESYVRGKFNNNDWGKIRIIRELESRNISQVNIENALTEINPEDYLKKVRVLFKKIINENNDKTKEKIKEKIYSRLEYKGWEKELIYEEINNLIN